jgi:DNA-binding phage protein
MEIKLRKYEEYLNELLQDPQEALHYLNECLVDDDPRVFLLALDDILRVRKMCR